MSSGLIRPQPIVPSLSAEAACPLGVRALCLPAFLFRNDGYSLILGSVMWKFN